MKQYYFADKERVDYIYGNEEPICIDLKEIERLAKEWELTTDELLEQMHEATAREIENYGVFDSGTYTVAELIEALQKCPEDYNVNICADEGWNSDDMYDIYAVGINHDLQTVKIFVV
jgi:hypothetical protein